MTKLAKECSDTVTGQPHRRTSTVLPLTSTIFVLRTGSWTISLTAFSACYRI